MGNFKTTGSFTNKMKYDGTNNTLLLNNATAEPNFGFITTNTINNVIKSITTGSTYLSGFNATAGNNNLQMTMCGSAYTTSYFQNSGVISTSGSNLFLAATDALSSIKLLTGGKTSTNERLSIDYNGYVNINSLNGSTTRIVQADSSGLISAYDEIIVGKIYDSSIITLLDDSSSWDIDGSYVGGSITGTYEGQYYANINYFFFAYSDNEWIRLLRG